MEDISYSIHSSHSSKEKKNRKKTYFSLNFSNRFAQNTIKYVENCAKCKSEKKIHTLFMH